MAMTEQDYRQQLQQLLPPGPAFDPELQPDIGEMVAGLAPEFARVDTALDSLQLELNPATVIQLLTDWEDYLGLPDGCTFPGSQTLEERQLAVINKMAATGAPQLTYYLKLGTQVGLSTSIEEFRPARIGSANVGDFLFGDGWPWSWLASVPASAYGTEPAATLDCRLQREAPEYTDVVLGFGKEVVADVFSKADQLFNTVHYVMPVAVNGAEE